MPPAFVSTLTISWFSPLLKRGWRSPLEVADLLPLPPYLLCESAYHAFLRGLSALPAPPAASASADGEPPVGGASSSVGSGPSPKSGGVDSHNHDPAIGHEQACSSGQEANSRSRAALPPPSSEQRLYDTRALLKLIWLLHGPALRKALLLIYGYQTFVFFQPVLLNALTNMLTHGQKGDNRIWILPALLFVCPVLGSLCKAQAQLDMVRIQIALRSQLTAAVYRKCLRLSTAARASLPSGRVVNLMSADVAKICDFLYPQLAFISVAPMAVVVSLILLWFQIGWATLVGLAVLLLSSPVSNIAVRATQRHRNEMLKASDGRMKLVGQFLTGVRVVKMYNWEQPQAESITKCRAEELRALRNMIPSKVAMQTLLYVLPQLAGVLSFLAVGLTNPQALTAARAFSSLVLFQIMRFPLLTLSTGLVELGAAIISARRITSFMAAEEQRDYITRATQQPQGTTSPPPPPPNARMRISSVHGKPGSASAPVEAAQQKLDLSSSAHHPSNDDSGLFPVSAAGSHDTCGINPGVGAATIPTVPATGPSLMAHHRGSRTGGLCTTTTTSSLVGIEPGLTIRAAGFRWAATAVQQPQEGKQKKQGEEDAGEEGPDGSGGSFVKGWRRLSFRRCPSEQRPFMEVVDAAGASLSSGAMALSVRLSRALKRQRGLEATYISSSGAASAGSPRDGGGDTVAAAALHLTMAAADPKGRDADGERVGLLRGRDFSMASDGVYSDTAAGSGNPTSDEVGDGGGGKGLDGSRAAGFGCSGDGGGAGSPVEATERVDTPPSFSSASSPNGACVFKLGQIDLRVRPGELVCVVGRVGSGKSSLVSAALGEMELVEELDPARGHVVGLGGRVAYVAQQAWIVNATLAENVTMGKLFNEEKWARCVEACALGPDLKLLPAGRETEIGEKGLNLSGGQKQRLALARAMYQEADIYLLDDPLSAVDVHVGGHIFTRMIRAAALAGAAVLLVTNAVQYLPAADIIVVIDGGQVVAQGTYQQCMEEPLFRSLLKEFRSEEQQQQGGEDHRNSAVATTASNVTGILGSFVADACDQGSECSHATVAAADEAPGRVSRGLAAEPPLWSGGGVCGSGRPSADARANNGADSSRSTGAGDGHLAQQHQLQQHHSLPPSQLPSISRGVSTSAYEARRASVELARKQQLLNGKCMPSTATAHMADLDEGNEMMGSLLRMSGDGGGNSSSEEGEEDGDGGLRGGDRSSIKGAASERAACYSTARGSIRGGGTEETRPLLSPVAAAAVELAVNAPSFGNGVTPGGGAHGGGSGGGVSEVGGSSGGGSGGSGGGGCPESCRQSSSPPNLAVPAAPTKGQGPSSGGVAAAASRGRITVEEDRELGQVKWKVYGAYMRAFHTTAAIAIVLFWAAEQGTRLATNTWLAHWSRSQQDQGSGSRVGGVGMGRFAAVYLLLGGAYAAATFCRSTTNNLGSYRASKILHERTLGALMAAPLSFFEATPVGRILNRLSRDVDEMDYNLAMYQQQLGNCVMRLLATIVFLCVLQPAFVGVVVPLAVIYFVLQKYFRRSSIELQRIDSVTRSPVYANFAETMAGLDTIRAYCMQERLMLRHETMVDINATAYYNARVADEWLSLRLDLIGSIIVLSIAALNVGLRSVSSVTPAMVALALAEAIDLTSFLNYAVKVSALVESRYNAVERLLVYAQLEPEESRASAAHGPHPYRPPGLPPWPATGELEFKDVWMSYRSGHDPVLQGVSFKVHDGQKVGIVGRTGSGKSSLIVALFRLVEPQRGQIILDGVDLQTLGLGRARTALSVIPQEPVLFSGTVRSNLDPWNSYSDHELWAALEVVAPLRDHVRTMGGLSSSVSEGGGNFSVGQRQLVCVARAMLRQPRVLVADEATASVDPETDTLIQRAIRTHFKSSTVLAIAHRLNTILDSDTVLLMEAGRVSEYGPVQDLLANPKSPFAAMVRDAGHIP